MTDHQREGASSNTDVGDKFREAVRKHFQSEERLDLEPGYKIPIGVSALKKPRAFSLGSKDPAVIVVCKSHRWTESDNVPSAKMRTWGEVMYYFHLAPAEYRKIFVVESSLRKKDGKSLLFHFIDTYYHLIPEGVQLREFDMDTRTLFVAKNRPPPIIGH